MIAPDFILDGASDASLTVCLAHGAGAPMDSPFMQAFAEGIAAAGLRAARFEFPYMAERRQNGVKKPPDRGPVLIDAWQVAIEVLGAEKLVIGGKSLGGRIASMVADGMGVRGLVCLGYPFHAPGREADPLRVRHLNDLNTPTLICQGTRDPFGGRNEIISYRLSPTIRVAWLEDGDHGFKPRKKLGLTERENWDHAIATVVSFVKAL